MPDQPNILSKLFLTKTEPRLRAGWRILVMGLFLVAGLLLLSPLAILALAFNLNADAFLFVSAVYSSVAITASVFLTRWLIDRRTIPSLGLIWMKKAWMDLVTGFGIAGLMISIIFLLELAFGWLTITGSSIQKSTPGALAASLLLALATFILVGWSEELLFRGYLLINLKEGLNWIWAVIITSVFFAVLHALNPNASWEAMIGLSISGVFFAYSALWSRGLWLPIGLHIGWNFFEGTVYGFPVSGQGIFSLLQVSQTGSTIMTGGAFGPEAGLVLIPGLALGFILVHLYSKKTRLKYPL